jgi:hypothetical protein
VAAGCYVEKGTGSDEYGPVNAANWDWPRLVELLGDAVRRAPLERAVARHGPRVGDYLGGRFTATGATCGFVGGIEDGHLVIRGDHLIPTHSIDTGGCQRAFGAVVSFEFGVSRLDTPLVMSRWLAGAVT